MNLRRAFIRLQFTEQARLEVYEKLRAAAEDGISLKAAIDNLYDIYTRRGKQPNHPAGYIFSEWSEAIGAGKPFHEAVGDWVPTHERMVLSSAEKGQSLLAALDALQSQLGASREMRRTIMVAALLPMTYTLMTMALFYVIAVHVVPELLRSVKADVAYDQAGFFLFCVDVVSKAPWIMPLIFIAVVWGFKALMPLEFPLRRKLDKMVPFNFYNLLQGSSWLLSLSGLTRVGVQQVEAIRMLSEDGSHWMRARCKPVIELMMEGKELGEALDQTGYEFPSRKIIDDIMFYEATSKSKIAIERAANRWLAEGKAKAQAIAALLTLSSMLGMGLVLVWSVFSIGSILSKSSFFDGL